MSDKSGKRLAELIGLASQEAVRRRTERLEASWMFQSRDEKRRRLKVIMQLSVELERIRETTTFATRLAESAIEAVVDGEWDRIEDYADHFLFGDEDSLLRQRHAPIFSVFRELLLQVLRTRKNQLA